MSKPMRFRKNNLITMIRLIFARKVILVVMYENGKAERYTLSDRDNSNLISVTTESNSKARLVNTSIYKFIKGIQSFDKVLDVQIFF